MKISALSIIFTSQLGKTLSNFGLPAGVMKSGFQLPFVGRPGFVKEVPGSAEVCKREAASRKKSCKGKAVQSAMCSWQRLTCITAATLCNRKSTLSSVAPGSCDTSSPILCICSSKRSELFPLRSTITRLSGVVDDPHEIARSVGSLRGSGGTHAAVIKRRRAVENQAPLVFIDQFVARFAGAETKGIEGLPSEVGTLVAGAPENARYLGNGHADLEPREIARGSAENLPSPPIAPSDFFSVAFGDLGGIHHFSGGVHARRNF